MGATTSSSRAITASCPAGAIIARDFATALKRAEDCARARGVAEIMVIGGADVFKAALPLARFIYKTEVHGRPEGDAYLPAIDWSAWRELEREAACPRAERMNIRPHSCCSSARPASALERPHLATNVSSQFALKGRPGL